MFKDRYHQQVKKDINLTKEEQEIEKAIEEGKYESVDNLDEWKAVLNAAAVRTLDKIKEGG